MGCRLRRKTGERNRRPFERSLGIQTLQWPNLGCPPHRCHGPVAPPRWLDLTFVKRVVAYGLPILVGSGYYLEEGP